ncbi:hypothetical protein B0H14DRAFT_2571865 [Mycena olivaceomarginata]|nr:hypothetical protein B0H14DRAFT_2571865 [Mycena olivaceomarginata]
MYAAIGRDSQQDFRTETFWIGDEFNSAGTRNKQERPSIALFMFFPWVKMTENAPNGQQMTNLRAPVRHQMCIYSVELKLSRIASQSYLLQHESNRVYGNNPEVQLARVVGHFWVGYTAILGVIGI